MLQRAHVERLIRLGGNHKRLRMDVGWDDALPRPTVPSVLTQVDSGATHYVQSISLAWKGG